MRVFLTNSFRKTEGMILLEPDDYPNLFNARKVSYTNIEDQIVLYSLDFPDIIHFDVEWKMKLPSFVDAFYNYFYFNHLVPDQQNLWIYYLKLNKFFFADDEFSTQILNAVRARLFRAYPSLVRDLHFSAYLNERFEGNVIYNRKLDIDLGIDILLIFKERFFALNLFTQTNRALAAREKKRVRHIAFSNVHYIDLPIRLDNCYACGSFALYGQKQADFLLTKCNTIVNAAESLH